MPEGDRNVPLGRERRIGYLGEVNDQRLLDGEDRVRVDVLAAGHEDVRGQVAVAGRGDDEVDVRRAERVPPGRGEQLPDRAIGGNRVVRRTMVRNQNRPSSSAVNSPRPLPRGWTSG